MTYQSDASGDFALHNVLVSCKTSPLCEGRSKKFKSLIGRFRDIDHLKESIRVLASDGGFSSFYYEIKSVSNQNILHVFMALKPLIKNIIVKFDGEDIDFDFSQSLEIKEGGFYEAEKISNSKVKFSNVLESLGYPDSKITSEIHQKDGEVEVVMRVLPGKPRRIKKVIIPYGSVFIKNFLQRKFLSLINRPFDVNKVKILLEETRRELFTFGYYLLNIDYKSLETGHSVNLTVSVTQTELFAFDFVNLKFAERDEIHDLLLELFRKYKRIPPTSLMTSTIKEFLSRKAFLNNKIRIKQSEYKNDKDELVRLYRIKFEDNIKSRISKLSFEGNQFFSSTKLKQMFQKEAFELASFHFYDKDYLTYFQDFLRSEYVKEGFVQAKVYDPVIVFNKATKEGTVTFKISEGPQAIVRKIKIAPAIQVYANDIFKIMSNKRNKPFNALALVEDLKNVISLLQNKGHYYAEIKAKNDRDIVSYNRSINDVAINLDVVPGPIIRLDRILFLGNKKTRKQVLSRRINLKPGEIITPQKILEIEKSLSSTGLFNSVNVRPLKNQSQNLGTDLLVKVVERDYGLIEVAPGYRTDLGVKLSGVISYQNIGGANRSLTLKSILNRRTSFSTIDPERRERIDNLIEHNTSLSFGQLDLLETYVDLDTSMAYQTRRFWAFDANIYRVNGTLTKEITKKFIASLRYQYEDITQYSASDALNEGSFQIGALTPSLAFDLRNRQVNPTAGAYFNLTSEFANPFFFSQKEEDLTINYYKLVSRNRFYIPYPNGTFAISLVGGVQENLAREESEVDGVITNQGYIPTIKVFRLTGTDIVRGFTDEEMNRLPGGEDISEVRISDRAYLLNLKLEPRYFINDKLMAGLFYDAGRVFVDHLDFGELRDSVGVSFKIITPVGTLDFDYGIKLLRKKDANGRLENPGRFHVSIGFF